MGKSRPYRGRLNFNLVVRHNIGFPEKICRAKVTGRAKVINPSTGLPSGGNDTNFIFFQCKMSRSKRRRAAYGVGGGGPEEWWWWGVAVVAAAAVGLMFWRGLPFFDCLLQVLPSPLSSFQDILSFRVKSHRNRRGGAAGYPSLPGCLSDPLLRPATETYNGRSTYGQIKEAFLHLFFREPGAFTWFFFSISAHVFYFFFTCAC